MSQPPGEVWHTNSPCDRIAPLEWVFAGTCMAVVALAGGLIFQVYIQLGGVLNAYAAAFVVLVALFITYMFLLAVLMERGFVVEIAFRPGEFAWRTRSGKVRSVAYSRVQDIRPWPRWAAVPVRFNVSFQADRIPPRDAVWLTHENKDRLIEAIRKSTGL